MYGGAGYGAGSTYGSGGMYGAGSMYSSNGMYGAGGGMYGGGYAPGGGLYGGGGYGGGGMYGRPMLGGYGAGMMPPPGESAGSAQQDWLRRPCLALSPPARDPLIPPAPPPCPAGLDPNDPSAGGYPGPPSAWQAMLASISGVVHFFGRLSFLVDENAHAVHFFIGALLQLLDR